MGKILGKPECLFWSLLLGPTNNLSSAGFGPKITQDGAQLMSGNSVQSSPVIRAVYRPGAEDPNRQIHMKSRSASLFINNVEKLLCGLHGHGVHPLPSFQITKNGTLGG